MISVVLQWGISHTQCRWKRCMRSRSCNIAHLSVWPRQSITRRMQFQDVDGLCELTDSGAVFQEWNKLKFASKSIYRETFRFGCKMDVYYSTAWSRYVPWIPWLLWTVSRRSCSARTSVLTSKPGIYSGMLVQGFRTEMYQVLSRMLEFGRENRIRSCFLPF